jgi:chromosome segregation ATPase
MSAEQQSITSEELEDIQLSYEEFIRYERDSLKLRLNHFKELRARSIKQWAYKSAAKAEINNQIASLQRRAQAMTVEIGMYEESTKNYSKQIKDLMEAIKKLEGELLPPPQPKKEEEKTIPVPTFSDLPDLPDLYPDLTMESFSYTSITKK